MATNGNPRTIAVDSLLFTVGSVDVERWDPQMNRAKAMDLTMRIGNELIFIECTDYDQAAVPHNHKVGLRKKIANDACLFGELLPKIHGTVTQIACHHNAPPAPVALRFVLLLVCEGTGAADHNLLSDKLMRACRVAGPPGPHWRAVRTTFEVVDMSGWNRAFPDIPVRRITNALDR